MSYPPLPEACAMCGGSQSLKPWTITRAFTPWWILILSPFTPLAELVAHEVQVVQQFKLMDCRSCREKRARSIAFHWIAIVLFLVLIFAAIFMGVVNESWLVFWSVLALAAGAGLAVDRFHRQTDPHYLVLTREKVEIEIPGRGTFVVFPL